MKKTFILIVIFIAVVTLLSSGCGNTASVDPNNPHVNNTTVQTATTKAMTGTAMINANAAKNNNFADNGKELVGHQKWLFNMNKFDLGYYSTIGGVGGGQESNIVFSNNTIYFCKAGDYANKATSPNGNGTLFALDAVSGKQKWATNIDLSYIIATEENLYGFGYAGGMYAFDAQTGVQKWNSQFGQKALLSGTSRSVPVFENGIIAFTDDGGTLHALDATNGQQKWQSVIQDGANANISNSMIYFTGSRDDKPFGVFSVVKAMDANTGQEKWSWKPDNRAGVSAPIVSNNMVYVAAMEEYNDQDANKPEKPVYYFYALDAKTGQEKWNLKTEFSWQCMGSASIGNEVLFLMKDVYSTTLVAIDSNAGKEIWRYKGEEDSSDLPVVGPGYVGSASDYMPQGTPAISNNMAYMITANQGISIGNTTTHGCEFIGLDIRTGKRNLTYTCDDIPRSPDGVINAPTTDQPPIFANGMIYFVSSTGGIIAIE